MKDYKTLLAYQPILSANIITLVEALQDKSLTKQMFHNKKAYAKRKKSLTLVLDLSIAFEIHTYLESYNVS